MGPTSAGGLASLAALSWLLAATPADAQDTRVRHRILARGCFQVESSLPTVRLASPIEIIVVQFTINLGPHPRREDPGPPFNYRPDPDHDPLAWAYVLPSGALQLTLPGASSDTEAYAGQFSEARDSVMAGTFRGRVDGVSTNIDVTARPVTCRAPHPIRP